MNYKAIKSEFGGQPLAGYLMNVIDLTRDKDGCDVIAFLKKIDEYTTKIFDESESENLTEKEFFFAISTEEDIFAMDFYVCNTIDELSNKSYVDGFEYCNLSFYRMYTKDEEWGLDEIFLYENKTEEDDMDSTIAVNIINITREFDRLYRNGEISNSDDAEEKMINLAHERDTLLVNSYIQERLKEIFPLEEQYDLVEVEVSRVRKVLEKATIKVAVAKSFGENSEGEAEHYVCNSFSEESDLEWEIEDNEYEYEDLEIGGSVIADTDTLEELESTFELDATLD